MTFGGRLKKGGLMGDKSTDNKFIGWEIVIELLKDVRMPCRTHDLLVKVQPWEFSSFTHVARGRCKG